MQKLENVYVIDKLENLSAYASLSPAFAKAVEFLKRGDFASLKAGRNDIAGDEVFVNNVEAQYVLPADRKPEVNHKYFDVHVPLAADEKIGLAVFDALAKGSFDEAGDGGLYEQKVEWFVVKQGEFCITWPITCAHAPAVTTDEPKKAHKLIVKVRA